MAVFWVGETIADIVPIAPGAFLRVTFLDASMTKRFFNKLLEVRALTGATSGWSATEPGRVARLEGGC